MASDQDRRNEAARALGYRNYYDYRVHDYGKIRPEDPPLSGEARSRIMGQRGAAALRDYISSHRGGEVIATVTDRDDYGRFSVIDFDVLHISEGPDGEVIDEETRFTVRGEPGSPDDPLSEEMLDYRWEDFFEEYDYDFDGFGS